MAWHSSPDWARQGWQRKAAAAIVGATWDALAAADTPSNSNRTVTHTTDSSQTMPRATGAGIGATDFKFFELAVTYSAAGFIAIGVTGSSVGNSGHYLGETAASFGLVMTGGSSPAGQGTGINPYIPASTPGTILVVVDGPNNKMYFLFPGHPPTNWNDGNANPAANIGGCVMTGITYPVFPAVSLFTLGDVCTINASGSGYSNSSDVAALLVAGATPYTG